MEHQRKIIKDDNKDNIEDKYKIYITYFSNKTEYENKNKKYIGSKKKKLMLISMI